MADTWTISVGGRVYGPYSLEQMQGFHAEKRLADHSLVAFGDEEQFHPASEDPQLSVLFHAPMPARPVAEPVQHARFGQRTENEPTSGTPGHFVIVADMKSRSISGLEEEIFALGQAHRFGAQAWVLSAEASINTVRTALSQKLGKLDSLFIVDATNDKAAWFNFGLETDTRIRQMWSRSPELSGLEKRTVSQT